MNVFSVRFDTKEINAILGNTVSYSYGFLDGVDMEQIEFNKMLAEYTVDALGKYIDSQARMHHDQLHHVYEWDRTGDPDARLFRFNTTVSKRVIRINGNFLPSKSISKTSNEPFVDKANIMENSIDIVIEPRNADVLAFEVDGESVFIPTSVYIANPGGDAVAGSFGRVVDDFFDNYFTNALMRPLISGLKNPRSYSRGFRSGAKGGGRSAGLSAGKSYLRSGVKAS